MSKIKGSIVAKNSSKIQNSNINIKKVKAQYLIVGFILGIISSLIANFIYYKFFN